MEYLKKFFIRAYGKMTIFQNEDFLYHFFNADLNNKYIFSNCIIAINKHNEIVSHYGGLQYSIKLNQNNLPMIWGVNAYTLPEYRGLGINSKIVEFITNNYELHGVIGFSKPTALFYEKVGYNIFNFEKFSRHILVLDQAKTKEVAQYIKQDPKFIIEQSQSVIEIINNKYEGDVVELTEGNIGNYKINFEEMFPDIATTNRTPKFLKWRFFENPFIKYVLYGFIDNGAVVAYVALRQEVLSPLNYQVTRIIDMFGRVDGIRILLDKTIMKAINYKHIYIDFSKFGTLYEEVLNSVMFIKLINDDCSILPLVTSPIDNRPNGEFLGIISKPFFEEINNLSPDKVYFTRVDSDRDRLANINQIPKSTR